MDMLTNSCRHNNKGVCGKKTTAAAIYANASVVAIMTLMQQKPSCDHVNYESFLLEDKEKMV